MPCRLANRAASPSPPTTPEAPGVDPQSEPPERRRTSKPAVVVVIDDAPDLRALLKARLRVSQRFELAGEGSDGRQAVDLAHRVQPDVMVLDVSMPDMDGFDALPAILDASPRTRVVMYSGFGGADLAEEAKRLGAAGFVEKAEPLEALLDTLESLVAGQQGRRGVVAAARDPGNAGPVARQPAASDRGGPDEQRVLEDQLDRERFREGFDYAAIGMATMTLTGRLVRANRAMGEALGVPSEQLVGASYPSLLDEGGRAAVLESIARCAKGPGCQVTRLEHAVDAGAGQRIVVTTLVPVLDAKGRPLYLLVQVQDVTAHVAASAALRESEERFRLLVEAVQDYAIFVLDPEGRIASWNAGAERIKGYTADEAIGQHVRIFYPPEQQDSRHPEHELELALRDGRYGEEGWRVRKDGSRFYASVLITTLRDEHGRLIGFGKVTRDITERRDLLSALEAMNERLARTAAEQSTFLGVTAHELRGPIGVLAGSADLLAGHFGEMSDEERSEILVSMKTSAARLRRVLADLLTVSRLEAGKVELAARPVAVLPALTTASAAARKQERQAEISVQCDPDLAVLADPDRLAQILDNLVSNALRHGSAPVRLSAARSEGTVRIRVEDAGDGVPEEMRAQLFERFATSLQQSGSGLGLFIVRELARAQNGDAWYDAPGEVTKASTFVLELPAARPSSAHPV
jgi:PAS domain S-box-containing protein